MSAAAERAAAIARLKKLAEQLRTAEQRGTEAAAQSESNRGDFSFTSAYLSGWLGMGVTTAADEIDQVVTMLRGRSRRRRAA